jgi:hypothetical protein
MVGGAPTTVIMKYTKPELLTGDTNTLQGELRTSQIEHTISDKVAKGSSTAALGITAPASPHAVQIWQSGTVVFEIACFIEGSRVTEATNRVKGEIGRAKQELRSVTRSGQEVKVLPGTQATCSAQHFSSLQNMPHVVSPVLVRRAERM